jgi:hypothetical protein
MSRLAQYRKAIAAALSGVLGVAAFFMPGIVEAISPEVIASVSALLATVLVWIVPNAAPPADGD